MQDGISPELRAFHEFFDPRKELVQERLALYMRTMSDRLAHAEPRLRERAEAEYAFVVDGGKRMRGVLAMAGYELAGGTNTELSLTIATVVELFHAAILVHDDIIDRDALRRGAPTIHEQFGMEQALLVGDRLGSLAYHALLQAPGELQRLFSALRVLHEEGYKTGLGAQLELLDSGMSFHAERAQRSSRLKTAHYSLVAPMKAGALLAGKQLPGRLVHVLVLLGELFQWKDDALGVLTTQTQLGKPRASDWREGRVSPLWLQLEREISPEARTKMHALQAKECIDIDQLDAWIERYNIATRIHALLDRQARRVQRLVRTLFLSREQKAIFHGFIEFVWTRST